MLQLLLFLLLMLVLLLLLLQLLLLLSVVLAVEKTVTFTVENVAAAVDSNNVSNSSKCMLPLQQLQQRQFTQK